LTRLAYFEIWSILHQRAFLDITEYTRARPPYPILPGLVYRAGYCAGPWFRAQADPGPRNSGGHVWPDIGCGLLLGFVLLRYLTPVRRQRPWALMESGLRTS